MFLVKTDEAMILKLGMEEGVRDDPLTRPLSARKHCRPVTFLLICMGLASIVLSLATGVTVKRTWQDQAIQSAPSCKNPSIRREWRELSEREKEEYIDAVQCLRAVPSELHPMRTLYDDFPWVHSHIGRSTHNSAAFLSWHRYFIHVYETKLREQCGYTGTLTYWDWTLDWQDLRDSPIWDTRLGFGGNGNVSGAITVGDGGCVSGGPFANLTALIYGTDENVHCLSRGFRSGQDFNRHCRDDIGPHSIQTLLRSQDYESFNTGLEDGAHRLIPICLRGDWLLFSSPYGMHNVSLSSYIIVLYISWECFESHKANLMSDPVFFLHHTQIDRLWWIWQQQDLETRLSEYLGKTNRISDERATLADSLDVGPLAPQKTVSEVMETESEMICYRY